MGTFVDKFAAMEIALLHLLFLFQTLAILHTILSQSTTILYSKKIESLLNINITENLGAIGLILPVKTKLSSTLTIQQTVYAVNKTLIAISHFFRKLFYLFCDSLWCCLVWYVEQLYD